MSRATEVKHFLGRAQDFLRGMQFFRGEEAYRNSCALLGIHSGVAYTDALRMGLGDKSLAAEDHQNAVNTLRRLLSEKAVEDLRGLAHIERLISKKSAIAYGITRVGENDYKIIFDRSERFAAWANDIGSRLRIEGWR